MRETGHCGEQNFGLLAFSYRVSEQASLTGWAFRGSLRRGTRCRRIRHWISNTEVSRALGKNLAGVKSHENRCEKEGFGDRVSWSSRAKVDAEGPCQL